MPNTILITGASSGIGLATAKKFLKEGWNVAATMRSPEKSKLEPGERLITPALDVTKPETITRAIQQTKEKFGEIDVILNNAGYAQRGPFEAASREDIKQQLEVNVVGLIEVTRQITPEFRKRGAGRIINVASMGGHFGFPYYSLYHASKWAVEGFSESLHNELTPFGVQVKIIEPGVISTDFYSSSMANMETPETARVYNPYMRPQENGQNGISGTPNHVANTIYQAATDKKPHKLRYISHYSGSFMIGLRRILPDRLFLPILRRALMRKS